MVHYSPLNGRKHYGANITWQRQNDRGGPSSDTWKDRETGDRREKTEWHRVIIWDEHLTDICKRFLKKGSKVYLEGTIQTQSYKGQDGTERNATEVVLNRGRGVLTMLDSASRSDGSSYTNKADSSGPIDDDIPF